MAKNTRVCRYANCPFEGKLINLDTDEYESEEKKFYHKECFERMKKEKEKQALINADIACILDLWQKHISNTVNYGYLRKILNEYLERGVSSDYMVYTMQYVVEHKLPLRYPPGFRYMLDRQEIQDAYKKQQAAKLLKQQKEYKPQRHSEPPKFAVKKNSGTGFGIIANEFNK